MIEMGSVRSIVFVGLPTAVDDRESHCRGIPDAQVSPNIEDHVQHAPSLSELSRISS
jgi:hypothetical protein